MPGSAAAGILRSDANGDGLVCVQFLTQRGGGHVVDNTAVGRA